MNRREFLRVAPTAPVAEPEVTLLRFARTAMATVFQVLLPWGTPRADSAAGAVLDCIDRLEAQLTVFRETSEVSRLNRLADRTVVPVEHTLFDLLTCATRLSEETGGAFDITAGPLVKAWGFYRRQGRLPTDAELAAAIDKVGMRHIAFDLAKRSIRYRRPGVEINLGSIGKGFALDQAAEILRCRRGIDAALLNGGNSSVLAIGAPPNDDRGWTVGLRNPAEPDERLAVVRLRSRAMATSAATYQNFGYNGRTLGHLLDPRTGRPAEGVALATAFAPTAAEADALATAFYVLGPDGTQQYCESHPGVSAIILRDEQGAELESFNLPPGDLILAPTCINYAEPE
jgi:thiamine biosynthesis lipoprotein